MLVKLKLSISQAKKKQAVAIRLTCLAAFNVRLCIFKQYLSQRFLESVLTNVFGRCNTFLGNNARSSNFPKSNEEQRNAAMLF